MVGERKWLTKILEKKESGSFVEEEWHFEPLPTHLEAARKDRQSLASLNSSSTEPDSLERISYHQDLGLVPKTLPFSTEKVGWLMATQFFLEAKSQNLLDNIRLALSREYELGNQFNFVPVILSLGIGAYYFADSEPSLIALTLSFLFLLFILIRIETRGFAYGLGCISIIFIAGLSVAKFQMDRAAMPIPLSQITGHISGVVHVVDQNRRGAARYLVKPHIIEGLAKDELPKLIRLSASKKHETMLPGDGIIGLARLQPISGPAYPGSYDFSFASYLDGLGLSGFFMGAPTKLQSQTELGVFSHVVLWLQGVRGNISNRIRTGLPGEVGDIATALITGDRSGLSDKTQESLRRSGLAHILAISGLHMALVTLTVIWFARLILVLVPNFADNYPIKKWAIGLGFITATLYLFLSGASIATQRAWLMITVMLAASFMDRRALTMRSVTLAALIILIISPASLFQPGFQMSFAAVAALVAVYQDWTRLKHARKNAAYEPTRGWAKSILGYFSGLSATSLIAGFATALIAMAHFHRVAPMGLVSNLVAMPLVSMLVMPLSLLSMLLMPYGFESLALAPLGKAIGAVVWVADWVNSFEFDFETGHRPSLFLVMSGGFLILGCFLRTKLRLLAIVPIIGLIALLGRTEPLPDMLIGQDGRSIAVRTALISPKSLSADPAESTDGMALLYPRSGKFTTEIWQKAFLPNRQFDIIPQSVECSKDRCHFAIGERKIEVIFDPKLLKSACLNADLLIAPRLWWVNCRGKMPEKIITRSDLEKNGSYQLSFSKTEISTKTAWPAFEKNQPRRNWQLRFDNVARRYRHISPIEQGPPRRRSPVDFENMEELDDGL